MITTNMYITSTNGESNDSCAYVTYLGTDFEAALACVEDFVQYEVTIDHRGEFTPSYSAVPQTLVDWEMVRFYFADGHWVSIVKFQIII